MAAALSAWAACSSSGESDPPEHYCAATLDAQVAALCALGTQRISKRICSHYTIIVMQRDFDPGAGCFYETATNALVAYEYRSDIGPRFHVGPPLDDACTVDLTGGVDPCPP